MSAANDNLADRLAFGVEEAATVMCVGKLMMTGGAREHWDGSDLIERLQEEVGDLSAAVVFVTRWAGLDQSAILERTKAKIALFEQWHVEQRQAEATTASSVGTKAEGRSAQSPIPQADNGLREKVARLVNPTAWRAYDDEVRDCKFWGVDLNPIPSGERFIGTGESLKRADAILALIATHPVQAPAPKAVAWVLPDDLKRLADPRDPLDHINIWGHRAWTGFVPLYTHPVQGGEG